MIKALVSAVLFATLLTSASVSHALSWKGIFIAGDDSIENFDNGREDLTQAFSAKGTLTTVQLSSSSKYIDDKAGVYAAIAENIIPAFENMSLKSDEGCFVHMTSHGIKGQGFYLSMAGVLTPDVLNELVTTACGDAPTVILISACYSGQFVNDGLAGPNRVILTAARADRPSFGCSADTEYTYWDGCMLREIPNSNTWVELYANVNTCISDKEAAIGATPSEPQAFFGENTKDWTILH